MTDQTLIERYLGGDTSAFNLLVWRWQKKILNFAYRYTNSLDIAKELTQNTFIRVYKNLHRLKDAEKFVPWLYRIALNVCRDHSKAQKRVFVSLHAFNGEREGVLPMELWTAACDHPDEKMQQKELSQQIADAIQTLPEEQRVVVIMKQYQGLKFTEIAEMLQVPVNTVKSRMYYGLAALREVLTAWQAA
ncbi:sigma-70 family RNA polymerase sigma factor [candidate division KSB1 bacterium]|nr:sigma-70 family RNA polymerase sigma factor [candidate division KSB1 bacterium]